jgi:hypothetical protein
MPLGCRRANGAVIELKIGDGGSRLALRAPYLWIDGTCAPVVWDMWARPYFECPRCGKRRQHLHCNELACRTCLGLSDS